MLEVPVYGMTVATMKSALSACNEEEEAERLSRPVSPIVSV